MTEQFFIRPTVEGARLPDPGTADHLKMEGEWKPRTPHWLRMELRGDVEQCEPPADEPEPTDAPPSDAPDASTGIIETVRSRLFGASDPAPAEPATDAEH